MDYREVSLLTINNGAIDELFTEGFEKILENIRDPNTDIEKVREINIKIKIKPSSDRIGAAQVKISCDTKLAGPKPHDGNMVLDIDKKTDEIRAYTFNPNQQEFPEIVRMENEKLKKQMEAKA